MPGPTTSCHLPLSTVMPLDQIIAIRLTRAQRQFAADDARNSIAIRELLHDEESATPRPHALMHCDHLADSPFVPGNCRPGVTRTGACRRLIVGDPATR